MSTFTIEPFRGKLTHGEDMKIHTTMRVGGAAPLFIEPSDEESLVRAVRALREAKTRFFVLGGGSNTILPDTIDFAVLSTRKLRAPVRETRADGSGTTLTLAAGLSWQPVCAFCKQNAIGRFAPFCGLPGTVGGAVRMNATCFGFSAGDALVSVRYLDIPTMSVREYRKDGRDFSYKKSPFQDGTKIILSADFLVRRDEEPTAGETAALYDRFFAERVARKHFSAPSAGSVFKNDPETSLVAGKIIDECGLKGTQVGGAKVAEWHGNIIINTGNASAKDIRDLVRHITATVKAKKNVELACEIVFAE